MTFDSESLLLKSDKGADTSKDIDESTDNIEEEGLGEVNQQDQTVHEDDEEGN